MDPEKRRALSDFYREEFARYLAYLESNGIVSDKNRKAVGGACRWLTQDLDRICWRSEFPALAESLLERFDALTRLSAIDARDRH